MSVSVEVRFPLGRYHATPWDRHVNEGAVEWPPSPWRIARALFAVWKEREPHLPARDVLEALESLAAPPIYRMPRWTAASTRHYYPDASYLPAPWKASVDKVIDAFVVVHPEDPLILTWPDADLGPGPVDALATLVSSLPFLGRAESICVASLVDDPTAGDVALAPDPDGDLRIAVPTTPLDPTTLTVTTDGMRKARLRQPIGMTHVRYPDPQPAPAKREPTRRPDPPVVNAAVLTVSGTPAPPTTLAVPLADLVFAAAQKAFTRLTGHDAPPVLTGHPVDSEAPRRDGHAHLHVFPLARASASRVDRLVLWAPEGLDGAACAAIGQITDLRLPKRADPRRHRGPNDVDERGERDSAGRPVVRGLAPARVLLSRLGDIGDLAPELVGPASVWISRTPFVPPRHQKRRHRLGPQIGPFSQEFLVDELSKELLSRGIEGRVIAVEAVPEGHNIPAQRYRRHRIRQRLADARPGVWLQMRLDGDVPGPLALGALSHYGLGLFEPAG